MTPQDTNTFEELVRRSEAGYYNATGIDSSDLDTLDAALGLRKRAVDCNNRPNDINGIAACGPRFLDMANNGWGPAVEAMPQFDSARLDSGHFSCYPEFAGEFLMIFASGGDTDASTR